MCLRQNPYPLTEVLKRPSRDILHNALSIMSLFREQDELVIQYQLSLLQVMSIVYEFPPVPISRQIP